MRPVVITRASIAALAIAAAVAVGGCTTSGSSEDSAGDFQGEQRRVAQVVEDLQDAARQRDGNEVCEQLLTQALRNDIQRASGESCASAIEDVLGDVDATELQVERVTISGQTAQAVVRGEAGDDERTDTLSLRRERRGWRIAGLGS